jgi:hypothetical protein
MEPKPRYEQALEYEQRDEFATASVLYRECLSCAAYHQGDILFKCGWCLERIGNSNTILPQYHRKCTPWTVYTNGSPPASQALLPQARADLIGL